MTNTARVAGRERTDESVAKAPGAPAAGAARARLEGAGIACARPRGVFEVAGHPQLAYRERWREVGTSVGPLRVLLPPITSPGGAGSRMGDVPALGQHTDALPEPWGWRRTRSQTCAGTVWWPERGT